MKFEGIVDVAFALLLALDAPVVNAPVPTAVVPALEVLLYAG